MHKKKNLLNVAIKISLAILLLSPGRILPGTTGKISGNIKDSNTGEAVIGANILVLGTSLGAASDVNGDYIILNVPPGTYQLRASAIGYATVLIKDVRVIVDQTTEISFEMEEASVELGEIVVEAKTPLVRKDITGSISVVTRDEIESLPVQNFTDMLALQAGVVGSGSNIHIRGGRSGEVAFMIDGMYVQDPLLGGLATNINNDAIQELNLLSGTFNAEYGNAQSGVVNIITRDGGEDYSGRFEFRTSEFGIERYSRLHELRFNGSLSGPVFTNKLRFFVSGERAKEGSYLPFGYDRDLSLFGKLTLFAAPGVKIAVTNRASAGERKNYSHAYKYIPELYSRVETDSYQGAFIFTHTIANNFFYDLRLSYFNQGYFNGYSRDTSNFIPETERDYIVTVENGREYRDFYSRATPTSITDSRTATIDAKADFVWQIGGLNEVKFGFQLKKHWLRLFSIDGVKRPVNLQYVDDYSTDKPYEAAAYIQDKLELPYLIINAGIRFDYFDANVSFREDPLNSSSLVNVEPRYQVSPRLGIAHPITERTKLHFSYGHFFQNPNYNRLFENKEYKTSVREPIFGQPNLDAERTVSYEVGVAHQLNERTAISLTAYYKDITGLIGTTYLFPFVEGRFIGYTLYVNEDYANVKGFEVNLDLRPDKYFSGGVTYTYSVAKGSASSQTEQYPGTQESTLLYFLDFDKTHVFNASGTFTIPEEEGPEIFGIKPFENGDISLVFRASSGYPYTPAGRDIGFVVKNSQRMPAVYSIDLEIGKEFIAYEKLRFRVFAEILNVTDQKNVTYVYPDTGDPDYTLVGDRSTEYQLNPENYGAPRSIRLGIGMRF